MYLSKHQDWGFALSIMGIYVLAWFLQNTLLFNSDVSWLMLACKRLWAGGSYTHDFFEVNPPLIIYLYSPAIFFIKLFSVSAVIALRLYIFILASISLLLCNFLSKKIFLPKNKAALIYFILTLSTLFLLLPLSEFGQREHLLVLFVMPYFLVVSIRLQKPEFLSTSLLILIGVFAGLGFAIKPYFLTAFIMTELYHCYSTRKLTASIRIETISILLVCLIYALVIVLFHYDYLSIVMPIITQIYYQKFSTSFNNIILSDKAFFIYSVILLYCLLYKQNPYKKLSAVLLTAVIGFLFAFFMQRTLWYYHFIPAFIFGFLLLTLLFYSLITTRLTKINYISLSAFSILLAAYFYYEMNFIMLSALYYPTAYFSLFFYLFAMLLYHSNSPIKASISLGLIFFISILFYLNLKHTPWQGHLFILTTLLLLLFFVLMTPQKSAKHKLQSCFSAVIGMLIFAYPFYEIGYVYDYSTAYKKLFNGWLTAMHPFSNQSLITFSNSAEFAFPAVYYNHQQFVSRLGCFGWLPYIKNIDDLAEYKQVYQQHKKIMDFFIGAIAEDIKNNQPDLILVDVRRKQGNKGYFGNNQIDYIKLFTLDDRFATQWATYHYLKTIDGQPLYKFNIFMRQK